MKTVKRTVCALLCAGLLVFPVSASAVRGSTQAEALRFNSDSSFKILQLTDLHMHDELDDIQRMSELLIRKIVKTELPDLVVITGDIATNTTEEQARVNIDRLMTYFDEEKIPVAVTFGNHDNEDIGLSRDELLSVYMQYDCCIAAEDGESLPGAGTYNIPILASEGNNIAFNLWMIDSGALDENGNYASTDPAITQWYVNESNALKAQGGGEKVNSLMFQHIIVPEVYDAFKKASKLNLFAVKHPYNEGEFYVLDKSNTNSGRLMEWPGTPYTNRGQLDAVVSQGDVLGIFCGHDHANSYSVTYKGVDLVATPKAQFGKTWTNERTDNLGEANFGARVIILNEKDTQAYETRVITFGSLYRLSDLLAGRLSDGEREVARKVITYNILFNTFLNIKTALTELFTGSKVDFG